MKRIQSVCLGALLSLSACTPSVIVEEAESVSEPVQTRIIDFLPQLVELSGSIADWQPSRSDSLSELATTLSYWDYMDGLCHSKKTQTTSSVLPIEMDYGSHNLYFLAHSSTESEQDGFLFTPSKVTETFWADFPIEVNAETGTSLNVPLNRVVSKVSIILKDAMPEGISRMRMTVGGLIRTLDIETGNGKLETAEDYTLEWEIGSSYVGREGLSFTMFSFTPTPSEEFDVSVSLEALSSGGEVLFGGECASVPLLRNRCTEVSCSLFGKTVGFSATVAEDWVPPLEIEM